MGCPCRRPEARGGRRRAARWRDAIRHPGTNLRRDQRRDRRSGEETCARGYCWSSSLSSPLEQHGPRRQPARIAILEKAAVAIATLAIGIGITTTVDEEASPPHASGAIDAGPPWRRAAARTPDAQAEGAPLVREEPCLHHLAVDEQRQRSRHRSVVGVVAVLVHFVGVAKGAAPRS